MDSKKLQEELIQVAAVAVAIVEDLRFGSTNAHQDVVPGYHSGINQAKHVLQDVEIERWRQGRKWGPQHHDPLTWLAILAEEVGEAANEVTIPYGDWRGQYVQWAAQNLEVSARRYLENLGKSGS